MPHVLQGRHPAMMQAQQLGAAAGISVIDTHRSISCRGGVGRWIECKYEWREGCAANLSSNLTRRRSSHEEHGSRASHHSRLPNIGPKLQRK